MSTSTKHLPCHALQDSAAAASDQSLISNYFSEDRPQQEAGPNGENVFAALSVRMGLPIHRTGVAAVRYLGWFRTNRKLEFTHGAVSCRYRCRCRRLHSRFYLFFVLFLPFVSMLPFSGGLIKHFRTDAGQKYRRSKFENCISCKSTPSF